MRIAFAGTPEFSLPALQALADSAHQVVGVLTQPDRPAGRGQHVGMSPVKRHALERGLPVAQPQTLRTAAGCAPLMQWAPELLVVVAYGLILPPAVLTLPRLGCVNIHASLLPRWRGAAPIQRAILAGDAETGVTIMQMDAGLDTGPTLLSRIVPISGGMTAGELHDTLAPLGAAALMEALARIVAGTAQPVAQPAIGVTYAAKIEKSEALIDWSRPAHDIARQVCAFNPWPIAETRFAGEQLRVHRAHAAADADTKAAPGSVLGLDEQGALRVACGAGLLVIDSMQRQGRRTVSAREFANGSRLDGARFQ